MKKYLSSISAVLVFTALLFNLGCEVKSVSPTVTTTTTTNPNGSSSRSTTISVPIVLNLQEELPQQLAANQFFVVTDMATALQAGTPALQVTKSSSGGLTSSSFALEPDTTNQSSIKSVDSTTTPTVYKLVNESAFDSFVGSSSNAVGTEETINVELSFETSISRAMCSGGRSYTNHIRIGSGNNTLLFSTYTYTVNQTPPLQPCDLYISSYNSTSTGSLNSFLSNF